MFKLLFLCFDTFGFAGLIIWLKFKLRATRTFNIPGIPFPVHLRPGTADEYTFKEIFLMKEYDFKLPASHQPKFIIDAGANIGLTSILLSARYPDAKIISIEPDSENYAQLELNCKPYTNITPLRAALWSAEEFIQVNDQGYGIRGYVVEKSKEDHGVIGITIPGIMKKYSFPVIDILKMDIEGSEKEVMESKYEEWLPKVNCLVIELHDRMKPGCSKSVFSAMIKYDFDFSTVGENLIFVNQKKN